MKARAVSEWSWVCLVLVCTAINITHSQECTESLRGGIGIAGAIESNFIAGILHVCDGEAWRTVCAEGWDMTDAMVVCKQLRFPPQGTYFCNNSCFGNGSSTFRGVTDFSCTGSEEGLFDCAHRNISRLLICRNYVGVTCVHVHPSLISPENDTVTTPISCDCAATCSPCDCGSVAPFTNTGNNCDCSAANFQGSTPSSASSTDSNRQASSTTAVTALTVVLGLVSVALLFALVGVVFGWVWSCRRMKFTVSSKCEPDTSTDNAMNSNPCYTTLYDNIHPQQTTPTCNTSASSQGAEKTTPTHHTSVSSEEAEEGDYVI